eukprot:gene3792-biopygen3735
MKIVSDRDPRFQDAMWKELMRLIGTKVTFTTPYNPRSDGHADHTNRVVEDVLRSFVGSNPEDWDLWCANAEFAINWGVMRQKMLLRCASKCLRTPAKVLVDGQSQTHVSKILARRVKPTNGGREVEEFLVRWTGYSNAHDSWKTRESLNYGGELEQLNEFERLRLSREGQAREQALQEVRRQRKQKRKHARTLTFLDTSGGGDLNFLDNCLPREQYCRTSEAFVTHLALATGHCGLSSRVRPAGALLWHG